VSETDGSPLSPALTLLVVPLLVPSSVAQSSMVSVPDSASSMCHRATKVAAWAGAAVIIVSDATSPTASKTLPGRLPRRVRTIPRLPCNAKKLMYLPP
jgi:hypothetical protein